MNALPGRTLRTWSKRLKLTILCNSTTMVAWCLDSTFTNYWVEFNILGIKKVIFESNIHRINRRKRGSLIVVFRIWMLTIIRACLCVFWDYKIRKFLRIRLENIYIYHLRRKRCIVIWVRIGVIAKTGFNFARRWCRIIITQILRNSFSLF